MTDLGPQVATRRIGLADVPDFDLGAMHVHPPQCAVEQDGERQELQPRVMQVLVALARARGSVVSRDRLIEECWSGRIVGDDALNRCILALRHLAQRYKPPPFAIETVPRIGHRLVVPTEPNAGAAPLPGKSKRWAAIAPLLLLLAAASLFVWQQRSTPAEPASIAVLPFRNLSGGTPYFAEGVGDEISVQLSREPQLLVMGRMSASQFGNLAPQEVGRKLKVDYVLEGSVRAQAERVRVTTSLVRASDGVQLWSNNYDGQLDDMISIQQQIGSSIAAALKRRLVHNAPRGSFARNGEAQNLYLTARGMLRERNPDLAPGAADLLRQALRLDPNFAPAWSSLAQAIRYGDRSKTHEITIAVLPQAERFARHSIRLDPENGEGHAVLGMLLGFASPEAHSALDRAIELEPNNVQSLVWLAASDRARAEFAPSLANYRRALELDPYWGRVIRDLAVSTAEMGDRSRADSVVAQSPILDGARNNMHGRVAWVVGDFSEAIRRWSLVAKSTDPIAEMSGGYLQDALFEVGLPGRPLPAHYPPNFDGRLENRRVRITVPPSPSVWRQRNRSRHAALIYQKENRVGAKLMLNADRAQELIATFDGPVGLLGMRAGQKVRGELLRDVPTVALALRQAGRKDEASRLLREGDAIARRLYRRGPVVFSFDADAAAIWAVQSRRDEALTALERAMRRGWVHIGDSDLKDLAEEPAFESLRGHPRFERLRGKIRDHYQRERQEIARLRI